MRRRKQLTETEKKKATEGHRVMAIGTDQPTETRKRRHWEQLTETD